MTVVEVAAVVAMIVAEAAVVVAVVVMIHCFSYFVVAPGKD